MTTAQMIQQAAKFEAQADTLHMSLLAPSMKEDSLRSAAEQIRTEAAKQEAAAIEYGRLARSC